MPHKFTIRDFNEKYPHDDDCLAEIFNNRYGSVKVCPSCKKSTKFHKVTGRKCYACQYCGYQLHPLAGTIFHKSETSLKSWFYAIFLFANSKNGVSAKELQRQTGVTYKTAWRIAKQIRRLFSKPKKKLSKTVEVDETYIGARKPGKRGRGAAGKTAILGMVQRQGNVITHVIRSHKVADIIPLVQKNVRAGSTVMTDELYAYNPLGKLGYTHKRVNHLSKKYVEGEIHTNTIEGFWSQLKRSINGTYHAVSPKYLPSYVDEFSYRYDLRNLRASLFYPMVLRAARPA